MARRFVALALVAILVSCVAALRTGSVSLPSHEDHAAEAHYVSLDEAFAGLEHMYDVAGTHIHGLSVQALNHPVVTKAFGGVFRQPKSHLTVVLRGVDEDAAFASSPVYSILDDVHPESVESRAVRLTSQFAATHKGAASVVVASEDVNLAGVSGEVAKIVLSSKGVSTTTTTGHPLMAAFRDIESKLESRVHKFFEHLEEHGELFDEKDAIDRAFITEMVALKKFFDSVEDRAAQVTSDAAADAYTFVLTGVEKLTEKYGPESEQVAAAHRIVQKTLAKSTKLFQHLYKDAAVELVAVSSELSSEAAGRHFEKRAPAPNNPLLAPGPGTGWGNNGFSTNPVIAGYQNCAPTAAICRSVYANCTGRGVCVSVQKVVANATNPDVENRKVQTCFVCDCTFTKVLADDGTVDTRFKNKYSYTGQMCQYYNISEHFHLLLWTTVLLAFLAIFVVVGTIRAIDDDGGYAVGSGVKSDGL